MHKILLIEDEENLREIYRDRLEAEGYTVVTAKDGEKGLSVLVDQLPDLVIADIMMPKISGFDVVDIIRSTEQTAHMKIIIMSALGQKEDIDHGTKLGADRYFVKSQTTLEDVVAAVNELLSQQTS